MDFDFRSFAGSAYKSTRRFLAEIRWQIKVAQRLDSRKAVIKRYLSSNDVKKLQIGAAQYLREGWLNTEFDSPLAGHIYLDATKPFPFRAATFDYIYAEHMLEHIPYESALDMLRECRRVMKPGGKIRIATPYLERFLSLFTNSKSADQNDYIKVMKAFCGPETYGNDACFLLNLEMHEWGHQFLYDEETLRSTLFSVGFSNIEQCEVQQSNIEIFRGMESHGVDIGENINKYETLVFEATN